MEQDINNKTTVKSFSALMLTIILIALFVAAVNFVGVMGRSEGNHKAGGSGGDKHEANEHSTPNDPHTRYKYTPAAGSADTTNTRP